MLAPISELDGFTIEKVAGHPIQGSRLLIQFLKHYDVLDWAVIRFIQLVGGREGG